MERNIAFIIAIMLSNAQGNFVNSTNEKEKHTSRIHNPGYCLALLESRRDFIVALEARGRLLRIKEMDQDKFEATAFAYRLIQRHGYYDAPAFLIERIKINNQWMEGPVIGNLYGAWDTEALAYGVEEITLDQNDMFRATREKVVSLADASGKWPRTKPNATKAYTNPQ